MRSAVKDQIKTQQQAQQQESPKTQQKSSSVGEYIDFEEIK